MLQFWLGNTLQKRVEEWVIQGYLHGVEYRFPLLSKPLVEHCLSLPGDLFIHKGIRRSLLLNSLSSYFKQIPEMAHFKSEPELQVHFENFRRPTLEGDVDGIYRSYFDNLNLKK